MDDKIKLTTPTLHLNGSSFEALYEQVCDVMGSLRGALAAMDAFAPNARDYYVQNDSAWQHASAEHLDRIRRVRGVIAEYERFAECIVDQHDERTARRGGK